MTWQGGSLLALQTVSCAGRLPVNKLPTSHLKILDIHAPLLGHSPSDIKRKPLESKRQSVSKLNMEAQANGLTHDEIWDDSALVDSWNQALEEYKVSRSTSPLPQ